MTMDNAARYVRAMATSSIVSSLYDPLTQTIRTDLTGSTDVATTFAAFTGDGDAITETRVPVPVFSGATEVVTSLGSSGDTQPPVITGVSAQPLANGATITWTTDEAASSQIQYGRTTAYGSSTTLDTTLGTSHSQTITGLTAGTVYHYRVLSSDAHGNPATSLNFTFTTKQPSLSVSDVSVTEGNTGSSNALFTVTLSAASSAPVTVSYATANNTATAGSDYPADYGTLTFAPASRPTVAVPILGDLRDEPDETFTLGLSTTRQRHDRRRQRAGHDPQRRPDAFADVNDVAVTEGNTATTNADFTLTLSAASTYRDDRLRHGRRHRPGRQRLHREVRHPHLRGGRHDPDGQRRGPGRHRGRGRGDLHAQPLGRCERHHRRQSGPRHDHRQRLDGHLDHHQLLGQRPPEPGARHDHQRSRHQPDRRQIDEFLYTSRGFPTVVAGVNEYENNGLPPMRFYTSGLANGTYSVYANLYTQAPGRKMRYFWGYSPTQTKQYSIDVTGNTNATEHTEYLLGSVSVTNGTFSIYAQDADLLSGSYGVFGWAWVRLVKTS